MERSGWLGAQDRALVLAVYQEGRGVSELAGILGWRKDRVRRRVRRLSARLLCAEFAFVEERWVGWPGDVGSAARACVLEGLTMREASKRLGVSLHEVRRRREVWRGMWRVWRAGAELRCAG